MAIHATGTFELKSFDEEVCAEPGDGTKLTRAHIVQTMTGDLDGELTADLFMYYLADGTATFMGFQQFSGRIGDRSGGFALQATGGYDGNQAVTSSSVVPGSGSAELRTVRGVGSSVAPHGPTGTYTLDYDLN